MTPRLTRRQFTMVAGGLGLLAGCGRLPWQGQAPTKVPRIGYVGSASDRNPKALLDGLHELGYGEGHNLTVEWRITAGQRERVAQAVAELVALPVDALVVTGVIPAQIAQDATRTIPIIMLSWSCYRTQWTAAS